MAINFSQERGEDYRPARRGDRGEKGLNSRQNEERSVCLHVDKWCSSLFPSTLPDIHCSHSARAEEQPGAHNLVFA